MMYSFPLYGKPKKFQCGYEKLGKDDSNESGLDSSEPSFFLVKGQMYNSKGYKICGYMNSQLFPCQRIGKCPFHGKKAKQTIEKYPLNIIHLSSTKQIKKKPFRKGWTPDEHVRFLVGLKIYGRGCWKNISEVVKSRTPLQTQSHAQKYFQRQSQGSRKKKKSIHDQTINDIDERTFINLLLKHKSEKMDVSNEVFYGSFTSSPPPPFNTKLSSPFGSSSSSASSATFQHLNSQHLQLAVCSIPSTFVNPIYRSTVGTNNNHDRFFLEEQPSFPASYSENSDVSNCCSYNTNYYNYNGQQHDTINHGNMNNDNRSSSSSGGFSIPSFKQLTQMVDQNQKSQTRCVLGKREREELIFDRTSLLPPMKKIKTC